MPGGGHQQSHESLHAALRRNGWRSVALDRSAAQLGRVHAAPPGPAAAPPPVRCVPCASDEAAARGARRHAAGARRLVWLTLRGLEEAREAGGAEARAAALPALQRQLAQLKDALPANTLLLVLATGNPQPGQPESAPPPPGCVVLTVARGPQG